MELIGFMNNKNFYRKSFEDSLEDFTPWANRFKELPLYFMTFHGQEDFEIVKEVGILLCLSDLNFFNLQILEIHTVTKTWLCMGLNPGPLAL